MCDGQILDFSRKISPVLYKFESPRVECVGDYVLIVKIPKFNSESINRPGEISNCVQYSTVPQYFKCYVLPEIYANGRDDDGEGHVSVILHCIPRCKYYSNYHISCNLTVMDVSGDTKFPKIFELVYVSNSPPYLEDKVPDLVADKYISHETLFREPLEFLPEDCLTLHIELKCKIELRDHPLYSIIGIELTAFTERLTSEGNKCDLHLDSYGGKRLCEESKEFQRMFEYLPFDNSSAVPIPNEDVRGLKHVCGIIVGAQCITVESIEEVYQIYRVADKYDIPSAIETSRKLIQSLLYNENDPEIIRHVEEYIPLLLDTAESLNDVLLKEIVERFLKSKKKRFEDSAETSESRETGSEWTCEFDESKACFKISKEDKSHLEQFEFYR